MINKMPYVVASVFAVGIYAGTFINSSQDMSVSAEQLTHVTEKLEDVTSQLISLNTVVTSLQSGASEQDQWIDNPVQTYQDQPMVKNNKTIHSGIPGPVSTLDGSDELTDSQKRLHDELSQRIESASYGGFAMDDLLSELNNMPSKSQQALMTKVTELVNNGTLDPKKFTEGTY